MYNESSIAEATVKTVHKAMESLREKYGYDYEVLFSNDGSTDNCADIVRRTADSLGNGRIRVTGYAKNRGKGAAVRHAMLEATGDFAVCTDCDLAYGTDVIAEAVRWFEGTPTPDLVVGSRKLGNDGYEGYTFIRKAASKAYMIVLRVVAGFKLSDSQCGFKAYRTDAAHRIFSDMETDGFAFDIEVLTIAKSMGFTICEMPVKIINHRESKIHVLSDSVKMLGDLLKIKKRVKKKYRCAVQNANSTKPQGER